MIIAITRPTRKFSDFRVLSAPCVAICLGSRPDLLATLCKPMVISFMTQKVKDVEVTEMVMIAVVAPEKNLMKTHESECNKLTKEDLRLAVAKQSNALSVDTLGNSLKDTMVTPKASQNYR